MKFKEYINEIKEGTYNITPGNKFDSEWYNEKDDDFMTLEKGKGEYYGHSQKFDFDRKTKKEAYAQLKKWGYKKLT